MITQDQKTKEFKKYKRKKYLEYIMSDKKRLKKTNLTLLLVITGIVGVFLSGNNSYGFYLIGFSTGGILGFLRSDT